MVDCLGRMAGTLRPLARDGTGVPAKVRLLRGRTWVHGDG